MKIHNKKEELIVQKEKDIYRIFRPIVQEFTFKDLLQVIIGATILAVPIGFTQETWDLGENLPWKNILGIFILTLSLISMFVYYYYHSHKNGFIGKHQHFFRRIIFTYVFSFLMVSLILTLIDRAPWATNWIIAIKRVIVVTLPSSMSAVVADTFR